MAHTALETRQKMEEADIARLREELPLSRSTLNTYPWEFRIGVVISDGMWYSLPKWRQVAKVSEEQLCQWVAKALEDGVIEQSKTGARSYRMPLHAMKAWYQKHGIIMREQVLDFVFPARVWDDMSETEGFIAAPVRHIGVLAIQGGERVEKVLRQAARGLGRVRETSPGTFKIYCLSHSCARKKIEKAFAQAGFVQGRDYKKIYGRGETKRRELCDFSQEFASNMVDFYQGFSRSLLKSSMETIKIFLPHIEEQNSQILMWVLSAIEKFDECSSVPFSGYLNSVLKRWPYDLPAQFLGKEISEFQRGRAKAISRLKKEAKQQGREVPLLSSWDIAKEMGISKEDFDDLEEKHRVWTKLQNATTLVWDGTADEKYTKRNLSGSLVSTVGAPARDFLLAHQLSHAILLAALETDNFLDAHALIKQVDSHDVDLRVVSTLGRQFVGALGRNLKALQAKDKSISNGEKTSA